MNMKVLVLVHSAALGGASRSAVTIVEQLRIAGCEVIVLTPPGPLCAVLKNLGAEVTFWKPPDCQWLGTCVYSSGVSARGLNVLAFRLLSLTKLPVRLMRGIRMIREIVTRQSITTIYVNTLVLFPVSGILASVRKGHHVRVLWQIREVLSKRLLRMVYSGIARRIAHASDVIIAISTNEARAFKSLVPVELIHNAVPVEWTRMNHSNLCDNGGRHRVFMACDFHSGKGIADFLAMADIVHEKCPQAEFTLYTPRPPLREGPTSRILRVVGYWNDNVPFLVNVLDKANELSLRRQVRLIFDHAMNLESYRQAAVYVRADRAACPWGRDIIEAMWAGVPVVATGTCQEFVLDGQTGFLVPPSRPDLLADRVCHLLSNPELRTAMSNAGRARALELFSPDLFNAEIRRVFGLRGNILVGEPDAGVNRSPKPGQGV
jgi:glycosyltransferase involved in cell wall biosynthesis